jgi:soluble lytic murein transglycosylase-like protein
VNVSNAPTINLPTSQYVTIAQQDAVNAGISPVYFVRQIYAESGFDPNAYSPAGAVGIAQFEPSTAYALGVDPYDPISALQGAAKLMSAYNAQYGGDYAKALGAYNAGGGNVQIAVQNCGANWLSCMPAETQNYVFKIMGI